MLPYNNNNENSSGFNPNAVQQSTTIPNAQTQQIFQHNNQEPDNKGDDGSLSFLNIPPDTSRKVFDCKETNQGRLSNMTFWILDYYADIKTRNGDKYLVLIKHDLNDPMSKAEKFFTGSEHIKYTLDTIRQRNAFPRRVTMRGNGMKYTIE